MQFVGAEGVFSYLASFIFPLYLAYFREDVHLSCVPLKTVHKPHINWIQCLGIDHRTPHDDKVIHLIKFEEKATGKMCHRHFEFSRSSQTSWRTLAVNCAWSDAPCRPGSLSAVDACAGWSSTIKEQHPSSCRLDSASPRRKYHRNNQNLLNYAS